MYYASLFVFHLVYGVFDGDVSVDYIRFHLLLWSTAPLLATCSSSYCSAHDFSGFSPVIFPCPEPHGVGYAVVLETNGFPRTMHC